ncbi:MAG: hypothetical protein GY787_00475 [Alteromonadales bacterium]|jgi:hypothetical protein|nr:hypothetical protein [Alteromonadales bacterium]
MEEAKEKKSPQVKDTWEYKDRHYYLSNNKEPLSYTIPSRHTRKYPLVWFDEEKGYERELRYATNQKSVFVDEQVGNATLRHIIFDNGHLHVPKNKRTLQEFLNIHPHNGIIFKEIDKQVEAVDELETLEMEIDAVNLARQMDIDQAEAILRVELGSNVSNLSTKELKRDLLLFAKRNPALLINLSQDENVVLRNFAIVATENNIISLSSDQRTFKWKSNGRKLMTVPFDENPYSAMAAWFKTDEGLEVYKSIDKKLK